MSSADPGHGLGPIPCSPGDADRCSMRMDLDVPILGDSGSHGEEQPARPHGSGVTRGASMRTHSKDRSGLSSHVIYGPG